MPGWRWLPGSRMLLALTSRNEHVVLVFLCEVHVLMVVAKFLGWALARIGQPSVVGELLGELGLVRRNVGHMILAVAKRMTSSVGFSWVEWPERLAGASGTSRRRRACRSVDEAERAGSGHCVGAAVDPEVRPARQVSCVRSPVLCRERRVTAARPRPLRLSSVPTAWAVPRRTANRPRKNAIPDCCSSFMVVDSCCLGGVVSAGGA